MRMLVALLTIVMIAVIVFQSHAASPAQVGGERSVVKAIAKDIESLPVAPTYYEAVSDVTHRILAGDSVTDGDLRYASAVTDLMVIQAMLLYVSAPSNNTQAAARLVLAPKLDVKLVPADYLIAMTYANSQSLFRSRRAAFNKMMLALAVREARMAGQPTVGVVLPKYEAIIDAENTGTNFVTAIGALGVQFPFDWGAGVESADAAMSNVVSGAVALPSGNDLALIEFYKGVVGLNEFVKRYNGL